MVVPIYTDVCKHCILSTYLSYVGFVFMLVFALYATICLRICEHYKWAIFLFNFLSGNEGYIVNIYPDIIDYPHVGSNLTFQCELSGLYPSNPIWLDPVSMQVKPHSQGRLIYYQVRKPD